MAAAQLDGYWDDLSGVVDDSDAHIRRKLIQDLERVVDVVECVSGQSLNLEKACREYARKTGTVPDCDKEREAILLHVVCTWVFTLTEGWGLVCNTIEFEELPCWVQEWYEQANASDLAWLRRRQTND